MSRADTITKLGNVLKGARTALVIKVIGVALAYLSQVLMSRWMGAEELGIYIFALAIVNIIALISGLGIGHATVKYIPKYGVHQQLKKSVGLIRSGYIFSIVIASIVSFVVYMLGSAGYIKVYVEYSQVSYLSVLLIPLVTVMNYQQQLSQSQGMIALANAPIQLFKPMIMVILFLYCIYSGIKLEAVDAVKLLILTTLSLLLVQMIFLHRSSEINIFKITGEYEIRNWISVGFPMLLISSFHFALNNLDILLVGYYMETDNVAVYNAAARSAGLITFVFIAIKSRSAPEISRLYARGNINELQFFVKKITKWIFWPTLLSIIILVSFGEKILALFGPEFTSGYRVLVILAVSQLVNASAGPVGILLNMSGHHNINLIVMSVCVVLNLVLNILLIPYYGLIGAASATAITMIVWNIMLTVYVKKKLNIYPGILSLLRADS